MGTITLFFIAIGLSMDAFAVSLSDGMAYGNFHKKQAFFASFAFGFFQALMPVIGYFAGRTFSDAIRAADHWIALILLGFIGGKMIIDGVHELRFPQSHEIKRIFTLKILVIQAIATSIDALAVGMGFAIMQVDILTAAGFIGVVTFICCLFGTGLGKKFGSLVGNRAEIFGGIILCGIGVKIFLEHVLG